MSDAPPGEDHNLSDPIKGFFRASAASACAALLLLTLAAASFVALLFYLNRGPAAVPVTLAVAQVWGGNSGGTTGITASGHVAARTQAVGVFQDLG